MTRPTHPEVLIERVLQGADPRWVVESAVSTYLYYQAQRYQRDIVRTLEVLGPKAGNLEVNVNGIVETWVPQEGVDLKAMTTEVQTAKDPNLAMSLLKQYATKGTK